jgi:hypothetical protein
MTAPKLPPTLLSLLLIILLLRQSTSSRITMGYCSFTSPTTTYTPLQPSSQTERYSTVTYNHDTSNLELTWSPSNALCGLRPLDYTVDVTTNSWVVSKILKLFGNFPQNTCLTTTADKANDSVMCGDAVCNACDSKWGEDCHDSVKESYFKVTQSMIRGLSMFSVEFQVKASGSMIDEATGVVIENVEFWCFYFRKWQEGEHAAVMDLKKGVVKEKEVEISDDSAVIDSLDAHEAEL